MVIKHENLNFDTTSCTFEVKVDEVLITKYLKGLYRNNKPRFRKRFVNHFKNAFKAHNVEEFNYIIDNIDYLWDHVKQFSYKEAFQLENSNFRAIVFSSIDIREMIENLGAKRANVEGKELINKIWNDVKKEFEEVPYTVIYELYHVSGEKIGVNDESLPVVKCWCTTTNEEHWLWVDNSSFDGISPLDAISSTCVIYKSMHGKINHIIRQGDVFLFEMTENVEPREDEETMSLPMNEYFSLLKSQA